MFRYSFEDPCQGASNKYPQPMISWRNKKNTYLNTPLIWNFDGPKHMMSNGRTGFVSLMVTGKVDWLQSPVTKYLFL